MTFTAGLSDAVFYSQGQKLLGGLYLAAGDAPRPTALLLHGLPGVEKNLDIAYALRDAGWNCLYFHYRGSWGSEGAYSFAGHVADIRAATEWVLQQPAVDPDRLALTGNSMGGYMTFVAGAADPRFKALAPMCPLVDPVTAPLDLARATEYAAMLQGITPDRLAAEYNSLPPVAEMVDRLRGRPLLLITGDRDELFPPAHYEPLAAPLPGMDWRRFPDADHVFSTRRRELVETIVGWLTTTVT